MLTVETIGRIRRAFFVQGKTMKEIARELKVSRNTVRKIVRTGRTDAQYEREKQPRPRLGEWPAELDELLAANAKKAAREQLTLIRIYEERSSRGYKGGYDTVRRYARTWTGGGGQVTTANSTCRCELSCSRFAAPCHRLAGTGSSLSSAMPIMNSPPSAFAKATAIFWTFLPEIATAFRS